MPVCCPGWKPPLTGASRAVGKAQRCLIRRYTPAEAADRQGFTRIGEPAFATIAR